MSDILQEAEGIKGGIASLRNNVKALQQQHKQALFALTPEQTNSILLLHASYHPFKHTIYQRGSSHHFLICEQHHPRIKFALHHNKLYPPSPFILSHKHILWELIMYFYITSPTLEQYLPRATSIVNLLILSLY